MDEDKIEISGEEKKDVISINTTEIKKGLGTAIDFFKNKKVQNILIIVLLLSVIIFGVWIRTLNLGLLIDQTTGEYIPLALDPFYFLRIAETIIEQGGLPEVDVMRYPSLGLGFIHEILPQTVVFLYNIISIFDKEITLRFVDVISPVIFFALGLFVFFFLIYTLTKSKITALISSAFLAFIPPYLYRTLAGFSDHEAIGMFAFFFVLLGYGLSLKFLEKQKEKKEMVKILLFGLLIGFLSAFAVAAWGGGANFIFMIIPLSFGLFWLVKTQDLEKIKKKQLQGFLLFYFIWIISSILFGLIYGFSFLEMFTRVMLRPSGLISGAVLLFILTDFSLILFKNKINFIKKKNLEKYRIFYSFLIFLAIGVTFLISQGSLFSLISNTFNSFLSPFGAGRIGLTVAENKQPFLVDWISQIGKIFFWTFYLGMLFVGFNISKGISKKKNKILFSLLWIVMISGILFSRISPTSILNGTTFISKLFYFGGLFLFLIYAIWVYFKDEIKIDGRLLLLFSWLFFILIAARGAIRLFFVITPFAAFMGGYAISNLFCYAKKSKDELAKMILGVLFIVILIVALISFNNFVAITSVQAKNTGPSAGFQWQNAMAWVRGNTAENSIFVHWWDYGYWVQYLGKRPSVTDGGHGTGYWDHLIGRYLLTTPQPETALSFMKSHNVSYLLIDPTDLGKYPAYSIIGSNENGNDRTSQIPIMLLDPQQTQETADKEIRVYQGGSLVDEDIIYNQEGQKIFLPANKAIIAATILEVSRTGNQISISQPKGVFIYNNQQIIIPIRYIYFGEQIIDSGRGLDAVVRIISSASSTGTNIQVDNLGSVIYLSPKVSKSLFAQLYLMNDPFNNYPTIRLAYGQDDPIIASLKVQGLNSEEFIFFNGFRGSIKIWKVDYPNNIIAKEEFLRRSGEYAEFDDIQFVR